MLLPVPTSKRAKLFFAVAVCAALDVAGATGCGSPSSHPSPAQDASASADTGTPQDAGVDAASVSCDPLRNELCPQGQTCCFSGLRGTCSDVGSCERPFQVSCTSSAACGAMGAGVCCGSVRVPAGFDPSAFDASTFDPSAFDASAFGFSFACATACVAPDFELCTTTQECPTGDVCAGGAGMGLGFLLICSATDAGASPDGGDAGTSPDGGDAGASLGDAGPADASLVDAAGGD
jgi:hypothetical protein